MSETITIEEYRKLSKAAPKYGNKRADGFDSQAEARRYDELALLARGGAIADLRVHPTYELQPAFNAGGKRHRAISYEADFAYVEGGRQVVEDVKGARTKEFNIKEKLFRYRYPEIDLRILEV